MTKIEWTDTTWNPIVGCSVVSAGCTNCYAMRFAGRMLDGNPKTPHYHGTTQASKAGPVWTGKVALAPEKILHAPLRWKSPKLIFVNSMGDLFHEDVPYEWIDQVFAVMALTPQHTYQLLTKRPERMRAYLSALDDEFERWERFGDAVAPLVGNAGYGLVGECAWPLPNVWLGTSVEDQASADERTPHLLATPAAIRFISAEPLIGPINIADAMTTDAGLHALFNAHANGRRGPSLHWVIVGGESGPGARPMDARWVRSIIKQCKGAGVAVYVKQMGKRIIDRNDTGFEGCDEGEWNLADPWGQVKHDIHGYVDEAQGADCIVTLCHPKGGDPNEWPESMRIRQFPTPPSQEPAP